MEFPAFIKGQWITWKPMPGLTLGMKAFQIGAVVYGRAILDGMSEEKSHLEAEKAAFENYYRVKY